MTQGKVAIVDDNEFEKVSQYKWHLHSNGYASRRDYTVLRKQQVYLHRFIMDAPDGLHVDHIDGNKLNNMKSNLRLVNNAQNHMNQKLNKNNTSGYKGVSWRKKLEKWQSYICINGKSMHIGFFLNKHEAAIAYNAKAIELFGEFARLNEIKDGDDAISV